MKRSVIIRSTLALVAVLAFAVLAGCGNGTDTVTISVFANSTGHTKQSYDFSQALCARCHTHEGATAYIGVVNGLESPDEIYSLLLGEPYVASPSNVTCGTCHDVSGGTGFLGDKAAGLPFWWSSEFKTCVVCHQLIKSDGTPNVAFHESWGGQWMADRVITDTHYDDPLTTDVEGYIINAASTHSDAPGNLNNGTCRDCHDQHNTASVATNRQWARSGHGGRIATYGIVNDTASEPWVYYDFKEKTGGFSGTGYQDCQRCHTATGFRNLANDPAGYDPANNFFTATGEQRELLYCWACHIDNHGTIRDPGLFNGLSPYAEPAARIDAVPDIGGSNVCMACHSGRESGTEDIANSADNFSNKSFVNPHYLAAGGILYRTVGYEYAGQSYGNVPYFHHYSIGTSAYPETGSNGPCAGCHMEASDVGHTLGVVEKDANGVITGLPANEEICSNCHSGPYALTPEEVEHQAEGFENALEALEAALSAAGFTYLGSYPYFTVTDWTLGGTQQDGKDNMGAAFNFNLLLNEPGAFAHNSFYAKRLVFDSINWLDDGTMGATIDLSGFTNAAAWLQGDSCDPACDTSDDNAVTRP